ncbi:S-layer homology domain-containing protein [Microbacteriaceae bacterium VKM Ac-2855]|nr:S-layer homology domain-containing protein [Microbacteriaceae bacterium VKM Ac-2855]
MPRVSPIGRPGRRRPLAGIMILAAALAAVLVGLAPAQTARADSPYFLDVPTSHPFYAEIQWMGESGVSSGYAVEGGREYRPNGLVTRQAVAAFLYRRSGESAVPPVEATFSDVPTNHPFATEIEWMAAADITDGYLEADGRRTFRPEQVLSRQAMSAFLARAVKVFPTSPIEESFADVAWTTPFYREIEWMRSEGISTGTASSSGKPLYKPLDDVTRQALAAFLYRLRDTPTNDPTDQSTWIIGFGEMGPAQVGDSFEHAIGSVPGSTREQTPACTSAMIGYDRSPAVNALYPYQAGQPLIATIWYKLDPGGTGVLETTAGIGTGSSRAEVLAAYAGRTTEHPDIYDPAHPSLSVTATNGQSIVFSFGSSDTVDLLRTGELAVALAGEPCS